MARSATRAARLSTNVPSLPLAVGDTVNVVYEPRDWRQSHVYETGSYTFQPEAQKLLTQSPSP